MILTMFRFDGDGRTDRASLQIGVTAFDEWNCRADVAWVGADLRVRPQNRLRSGEDGRTRRSAPTKGYTSGFNTTDAPTVRPYSGLHVTF